MNDILIKMSRYESKKKLKFGIIKNNLFGLELLEHFLKKKRIKNLLFVIPHEDINFIENVFSNFKDYIFKNIKKNKIKTATKIIIISDKLINNLDDDLIFDKIFFFKCNNLNIKKISFTYRFLWIITKNPDLIYFNNSTFLRKLINNISMIEFEKTIINSNNDIQIDKLKIKLIKYIPSLRNQLYNIENNDISKNLNKIIKDYNINFKKDKDICDICYNKRKLINNCCNQNICISCKILNCKFYGKCPFCRKKYNQEIQLKIVKNARFYISSKDFNFNNNNLKFLINLKKLNLNVFCNNTSYEKYIVFINLSDIIIHEIMKNYLHKFKDYKILSYLPKYY